MNVERSRRLMSTPVWVTMIGGAALLAACSEVSLEPAAAPGSATAPAAPHAPTLGDEPAMTPAGGFYKDDLTFVPNPNLVPAYKTPRPYALKADGPADVRASDPQYYAITEPPANIAKIRPMVEWEPMKALVMGFPSDMLFDTNATQSVVSIAKHASTVGDVWILVNSQNGQTSLRVKLQQAGVAQDVIDTKIKFLRASLDSIWFIDYGPVPIVDTENNSFAFTDFRYYYDRPQDDAIPTFLARNLVSAFGESNNTVAYRMPLTMEGGTFQSTTDGICITSSREIQNLWCYGHDQDVWCDDNILSMPLGEIETTPEAEGMLDVIGSYAGCKDLVVLNSISDDGTGHIDMFLKIADDNRIVVGQYLPPYANYEEENAALLDANVAYLEAYVKPDGSHFQVSRVIMPGHRNGGRGVGSIPFTYINSTFFNGLNLWPASNFSDWTASRDTAQGQWDAILPDYENIWIDTTSLSFGSGAIHCITRTVPDKAPGLWVADGTCGGSACTPPTGGYDGACTPEENNTNICWGPAWMCDCNDCTNGCIDPCQGVGYAGCCDNGDVVACINGMLQTYDCQGSGCGWNSFQQFYDCQESGSDPSGQNPISCGCEPDCNGKQCGDDGCGGTCGGCTGGTTCVGSQCQADCENCTPGQIGCDGNVAWLCEAGPAGCNTTQRVDCSDTATTCVAGDCKGMGVDETTPEAATETGPDVPSEAQPETASQTTATAEATGSDASAGVDTGVHTGGSHEGCDGGGSPAGALAIALSLGLAAWRRRALR